MTDSSEAHHILFKPIGTPSVIICSNCIVQVPARTQQLFLIQGFIKTDNLNFGVRINTS